MLLGDADNHTKADDQDCLCDRKKHCVFSVVIEKNKNCGKLGMWKLKNTLKKY